MKTMLRKLKNSTKCRHQAPQKALLLITHTGTPLEKNMQTADFKNLSSLFLLQA